MDHHCPVINNCVGFGNYKFFVLLLVYGWALCWIGWPTALTKFVLVEWEGPNTTDAQLVIGMILAMAYALVLTLFGGMHLRMVFINKTTLEQMDDCSRGNKYDVGAMENFYQVFGRKKHLWPLPVFTAEGDGCRYPSAVDVAHVV